MKIPAIALLFAAFLLLSGSLFAGYTMNLTAQVFDQAYRPVEGASVYVEYELNPVKGDVKTKPKLTDSTGHASIMFTNYDEIENTTNYAYTLFVKYGNQLSSASLIASNGQKRTYTMMVESHLAFVRVLDQDRKPLSANLTVSESTKPTSEEGTTFFALPPGNYTLRVERGDLVKNVPLDIGNSTGDRNLDIVLSYYDLDVSVQDDLRRPLPAQVEVNGIMRMTNDEGIAHFENITTDSPEVIVTFGQGIKRFTPSLQLAKKIDVVFDLGKPLIKEQYSTLSPSGVGTVRFFVEDFGPQASGIDTVSVSYEIEGGQNFLSVYAIGYNTFEAKIPAQPAGTLVKYTVEVADKEGNAEIGYGNYVIPSEGQINQSANSTQPPPPPPPQSISNEEIMIGIVVLAIIAFAAIYYFNRKRGEVAKPPQATASPPLETPPQAPA
jgi:hypothetical protein